MENSEEIVKSETRLEFNPEIRFYLTEAARWGRFLAIAGYIGLGFILLAAIVLLLVGSAGSRIAHELGFTSLVAIIYIAIGVVYYFPVSYLDKFSRKMRDGLVANDQDTVTEGFENLKSLYKFLGIMTIVVLSLYALILIFAVIGGLAGGLMR